MREDICSIPINDIFMPQTGDSTGDSTASPTGCPFCRMRDMLEDRIATYITGAAMMEPDVREETNRLGFCETHFRHITARGSKLSVALILESLTQEVHKSVFPKGGIAPKKLIAAVKARSESCFICDSVGKNMVNLSENTLRLWQSEGEFRDLYAQQEHICLLHYGKIMELALQKMNKKNFPLFAEETRKLSENYLSDLEKDVTHFCRMFDYRNKNADWGNSKDASDRAMTYLTSRKLEVDQKAEEKNR